MVLEHEDAEAVVERRVDHGGRIGGARRRTGTDQASRASSEQQEEAAARAGGHGGIIVRAPAAGKRAGLAWRARHAALDTLGPG